MQFAKKCALVAVATSGLVFGAAGVAVADADAGTGAAAGSQSASSGSVLSGTGVNAAGNVPINVTGNSVAVLGNAASCGGSQSQSAGSSGAATAGSSSASEGSVLSGTALNAALNIPVWLSGNAISVLGTAVNCR